VMTLCFSAAKIAKIFYSTKFSTTSSPKVQCSKFILHSSFFISLTLPPFPSAFPQPLQAESQQV